MVVGYGSRPATALTSSSICATTRVAKSTSRSDASRSAASSCSAPTSSSKDCSMSTPSCCSPTSPNGPGTSRTLPRPCSQLGSSTRSPKGPYALRTPSDSLARCSSRCADTPTPAATTPPAPGDASCSKTSRECSTGYYDQTAHEPGRPAARLSGRQPLPPRWALGPMLDRLVKNVGETTADYEQNVESDLVNIKRYKLPLTAYRLEGWGYPTAGNNGLDLPTHIAPQLQASVINRSRLADPAAVLHALRHARVRAHQGVAAPRVIRQPEIGRVVTCRRDCGWMAANRSPLSRAFPGSSGQQGREPGAARRRFPRQARQARSRSPVSQQGATGRSSRARLVRRSPSSRSGSSLPARIVCPSVPMSSRCTSPRCVRPSPARLGGLGL